MAENANNATPQGERVEEISLRRRFLNVRTLFSFVVAFGLLFLVFESLNVDFSSTWATIRSCSPLFYALAFLSYYLSFPLRALRWRVLLHNAGFRQDKGVELPSTGRLTQMILINWFANSIVYARLGDAYRGYLLKGNANVSFSKTIGTILAERVIDVLVIFLLLILAVFGLLGSRGMMVTGVVLACGIGMLAAIAIVLTVMGRFGDTLERRLPGRFRSIYSLFQEGTLGSFGQLPLLGSLSVGIWLLEAGRLYLVTHSLGFSVGFSLILFAALAAALLSAIPFTPGGLGVVETGLAGLLMIALAREGAWSIALVDRTISYLSVILFGFLAFSLWHFVKARRGGRRRSLGDVES